MTKELKKVIEHIKARMDLNYFIIEANEDNPLYQAELKGENIALEYVLTSISKKIEQKNLKI